MTDKKHTPSYTAEFRARGVRLFREHRSDYSSDSAAYRAIASKLGCSSFSLRDWCRRAARDAGELSGLTSEETARIKALDLVALVVTLSWSRKRAVIWARSKDMLSWQTCQIGCLQRLGGVPAVLRIDNVKTAIARGAGAWGVINETYRRFATQLKFHVDACQPRHPQGKGKVERHARDLRETVDPRREAFDSLEHLQAVTDARLEDRARRLRCPITGTSIAEAWEQERRLLTPLPETLPEPFDIVLRRSVGIDCMVGFEGRQYSVPFRFVGQEVEIRGLAWRVQFLKHAQVIAEHPRGTDALIVRTEAHYDGDDTDRVRAPMPLGRMGRRLQDIAAGNVQQRSIDLYARLAEVAR